MRSPGFSVLELMIVLMLAGIVLAAGLPALDRLILDLRRTADINAFVTAIQLARSESAKRALPVTVCASEDGLNCRDEARDYSAGWIVFVNLDNDSPATRDPGEPVVWSFQAQPGNSISSNRNRFTIRPWFLRDTNGTVVFCDSRGRIAPRAVIISYTGRPRVAATDSRGNPLRCAV